MSDLDRKKWDARYSGEEAEEKGASSLLADVADLLPASGRALDLAGGAGRNAVWLAERGLDVTIADISPVGLDLAMERALAVGVNLTLREIDLERDALPAGPWNVVSILYYLQRDLFARVADILAPEGLFLFAHATHTNLERNERPPAHHLLEDGELAGLIRGLEVIRYEEGWTEEGRHEARLVAKAPRGPGAGNAPPP